MATCVTTDNESFIIDGKYLKSINQFYNKRKSYFQSVLPNDKRYSKRLRLLDSKRNRVVEDYLNKAVSTLITKIKELNVDEVIIKKNEILKGKDRRKANQNFVSIPLSRFKDKIIFKCQQNGIKVTTINESYTSKASFYDNDKIEKGEYSGKRIHRGLYKRYNSNVLINADVNAALNIYKKYILKCNSTDNKIDYLMSRGLTIPSRILITL